MSVITDGMTLLPEPDWTKPLGSFKPKKNGHVVARKDGGNGGKWAEPFSATWCFEPAEHDHHVSSFVACGLRAVAGGVAPCGCRQHFRVAGMVSWVPCEKHRESEETWVRARERPRKHPEITGYTRAKRPIWDDIRPGQVWRWRADSTSGKLTGKVVRPMSDMTWVLSEGLLMHRREFDRGEWTLVSDVEPRDTIPSPPLALSCDRCGTIPTVDGVKLCKTCNDALDAEFGTADLQPGIPGEPTYADHRQRYLDAMLRGERLHPPEWDKRAGGYVQCVCWHCMGCDAGRWSPWDHDEAERKIALAETAAKAVGYGLWTWGMGGRTDADR